MLKISITSSTCFCERFKSSSKYKRSSGGRSCLWIFLIFYLLKQNCCSTLCDFSGVYTKFASAFGVESTYVTIMEDLWDKTQEKEQLERLSNFLSYKITKLHDNCYVPNMGSRAPHLPFLQDQWESDIDDLEEQDLHSAHLYMSRYYTDFKNTFGYLPLSWKK